LVCGLFSAPVTFLTYAPVYAVAGVALLLGAKPKGKELHRACHPPGSRRSWLVGGYIKPLSNREDECSDVHAGRLARPVSAMVPDCDRLR